jgi:flagellar protein FlaG
MADLGIARPQEFLSSLAGRIDAIPTVTHAQHPELGREGVRRRPPASVPAIGSPTAGLPNAEHDDDILDPQALRERVERLNQEAKDYHLRFEVGNAVGRFVVSIVDQDTGEVLRTVPPSAVLKLDEYLGNEAGGIIDAES